MKPIVYFIIALVLPNSLTAQDGEPPLMMPEEREAVDAQTSAFNQAITPALTEAAKSTVRVWSGARRVAYGTVIDDGTKILSKWSEVARSAGALRVDVAGSEYRTVKVAGVYQNDDLVVLAVEGAPLTPVRWSFEAPKLGSFLAAPQPDGKPAAFGVVSVLERNLKETDQAYLGVYGEPGFTRQGVKIASVAKASGAAAAGLMPGNVILKVGDRAISGLLELKNALTGVTPGETISLLVEANGRAKTVKVLVGNREESPQFSGGRLEQMERMGGAISQVRKAFSHAIQTDMRPNPNQIGGPVVDLKGRVVGITVARADRTRSFVMPSAAVAELLRKDAGNPPVAKVTREAKEPSVVARRSAPRERTVPAPKVQSEERMLRHLSDMQRLMDHLHDEMAGLEEP
jgi:serine protease Do